ncbi:MAG TPA: FadR/GntR family transcriptional regulator [Candidatus Acidoferrales bacterium]|nr:FadR/GntR family transcriptional regulator [Candidatus Acidoferrales bacterium]
MQEVTTRPEFEVVRKKRVYKEVANQIEQMILTALKPGDRLPGERELAAMLGVSRCSLRDALIRLEVLGLIECRQGSGTVVRDVSANELIPPLAKVIAHKHQLIGDLLDFRGMLEPVLAARAARHATREDIAKMDAILARQTISVRRGNIADAEDSEFHDQIARVSRNRVVARLLDVVMDLLRETRASSSQTKERALKSLSGHLRIMAAIKRHDARAAEAAMRQHIKDIEELVGARPDLAPGKRKIPSRKPMKASCLKLNSYEGDHGEKRCHSHDLSAGALLHHASDDRM